MKYQIQSLAALFATAAIISLVSCAAPQDDSASTKVESVPTIQHDSSGWDVSSNEASDGSVRVTKQFMSEEEQARYKREYKQTDLIPYPIDPKYNVSLFTIRNVPEYKNRVFIAPKIFAYSAEQGGRLAPKRNEDGSVSLPFPVVLTDGSVDKIQKPSAESMINLPDFVRIQQGDELLRQIQGELGAEYKLAPLPGCPKAIIVKVGDIEYDATPADLSRADYCQMNVPFNVALRVREGDARYILEQALYTNAVDVRAVFETQVAFAISNFKIEFDKAKIFRELEMGLKVNTPYVGADIHAKMTDVMKRYAMKVHVQGDMTPVLASVVEEATRIFFEPFRPDPSAPAQGCSRTIVCLTLNYNYSKEQTSFSFEWSQSTNALTGQNYVTWTKLHPLQDKVIDIGGSAERRPLANNDNIGIETGLTLAPGDLLEITPTSIIKEERQLSTPVTHRTDNSVCAAREPIFETRCSGGCNDLKTPAGMNPDFRCNNNKYQIQYCREVQVGTRCIRSENRWTETTNYSMSAPTFKTISQPAGYMQQMYEGLALRVVSRSNGAHGTGELRDMTCPLNLFNRDGNGTSLVVRLENQPGCKIFSGNANEKPMLYLVNQINFPEKYKKGRFVRNWTGATLESPIEDTYYPSVQFSGKVAIKGYSFGSDFSSGERMQ